MRKRTKIRKQLASELKQGQREIVDPDARRVRAKLSRKATEGTPQQLEHRISHILALQKVIASIQRSLDLGEVLLQVARAAVVNLEYDHCLVLALDEKRNIIRGQAFYSREGSAFVNDVEKAMGRSILEVEHPPTKGYNRGLDYAMSGQVMISRFLHEILEPPLTRYECDAVQDLLAAKTIVSVPLFAADQYMGCVIAFSVQDFDVQIDFEPLKLLCDQSMVAAENAKLYDEMLDTYQRLRESEELTRGMVESAASGIYLVRDGRFQYVSPMFEEITGYKSNELIGRMAMDYIHPDDRDETREKVIDNLKGKSDAPHEFRLLRKDGTTVWVLEKVASIGYKGKRVTIGSIMDISDLKHTQDALRDSEEKLRFMFESIIDAVIVVDSEGKVVEANRAGIRLAGYRRREDLIGRSGFDFIAEKDRDRAIADMMEAFVAGPGRVVQYTFCDKDGKELDVEASGGMLYDRSGKTSGFIVAVRDITERKRIEQMKTDFVSLVSHQLKTPVAGIKAYIENMLEGLAGEVTEKQRTYLLEMRELCSRNYRLISDLLNISMIERGMLKVDIRPARLREVVDQAIRDYIGRIEDKGLALNIEERGHGVVVMADKDKLVEAVRNVVDNAIKFTDSGSITVRMGRDEGYGLIEVIDTGSGMAEDVLKTLFDRDKVLSGGPKAGAGAVLGLFIAKGFMKAQNGDVTATSTPGGGSTFTFRVPLK